MDDKILTAIATLQRGQDDLAQKVSTLEKKWQIISGAALLVVGVIGGPNAVSLISGHGPA